MGTENKILYSFVLNTSVKFYGNNKFETAAESLWWECHFSFSNSNKRFRTYETQ